MLQMLPFRSRRPLCDSAAQVMKQLAWVMITSISMKGKKIG